MHVLKCRINCTRTRRTGEVRTTVVSGQALYAARLAPRKRLVPSGRHLVVEGLALAEGDEPRIFEVLRHGYRGGVGLPEIVQEVEDLGAVGSCQQRYRWHLERNASQMPAISLSLTQAGHEAVA